MDNKVLGESGGGSFRVAGTLGVNPSFNQPTGAPFATGVRSNDPAARAIESWAANYTPGATPPSGHLYPDAIPYLALGTRASPMTRLENRNLGNPLTDVRGLAVHCTAGGVTRSPYAMANGGCVVGWNTRRASAHFGISHDGTVVQFIPTSHSAFAQGSPGDEHWISVEIDNPGANPPNGVKATTEQITAARKLFAWICRTFSIRPEVAAGHLCAQHFGTRLAKDYDDITRAVCAAGSLSTQFSSDPVVAQTSRGLSCHRWLEPYVKPCPGAGLLSQLAEIADGAARAIRGPP